MNRIFSLAIVFLFSTLALANPITHVQALRKAQDFAGNRLRLPEGRLKLAHVGKAGKETGWYAFNMEGRKGFVIVSGSDQTDAILGYSDQGEFDYDNMPENMKVWLEQYSQGIEAISQGVMRPARVNAAHPTEVVAPLITSLWGQKAPFNSQCPSVNSTNCPAGCTAVAMAQVMRYHKYPSTSIGAVPSYTTSSLGITMPELPSTTFDWDKMPDELTSESPQECIDEVARFLLYCGQSTEMNYDASGSGAYTNILPQRLPKYFNYPKTIHYVYRLSYDEAQWDSLLVNELVNGRPVIYTAYNSLSMGHTFVCDGYDGQGLYHINWGWVGAGNGYYRISVACAEGDNLDENVKNYQLSLNQTALLGVKPSGSDDFVAPTEYYSSYSRPSIKGDTIYTRDAMKNGFAGITLKLSFVNTSSATKNLAVGLAFCDSENNILSVPYMATVKLTAGGVRVFEPSNLTLGAGRTGHYTLKMVYKPTSSSDWQLMGGTDRNYVDLQMTATELVMTSVPKARFVVNEIKMEDNFLVINLDNNDEDFFGPIYLRKMVSSTEQVTQVAYDNISFESGTNREIRIYVDPKKSFDIYSDEFYLSVDEYSTGYFYTNLWEENDHLDKSVEILNLSEDGSTIVGDRVMCRVTVKNNNAKSYKNYLTISSLDSNESLQESQREIIELQPGDSLVREYDVDISDFTVDYSLVASTRRSVYVWESDTTEMKHVSKGAIYWTKDGELYTQEAASVFHVPEEAVAINLRNAYTSNVVPNSNPNTIYMLDRTMPSGLSSSNYVNASNKGSKLTLVDGYDYYFPFEMTFTGTVSYQREIADTVTFDWSTLTLPFTPTDVMVGDSAIAWYADIDSLEGDFWLFDLTGVENDTVRTACSGGVQANVPCLMACDDRLAGKTVTFQALKCTVPPTEPHPTLEFGNASFVGTNAEERLDSSSYKLIGNQWVSLANSQEEDGSEATVAADRFSLGAFRAYLTTSSDITADSLAIDVDHVINHKEEPYTALLGDANGDGYINMSDVTIVINYIVGSATEGFVFDNADVVCDGFINMSDVTAIINIILGKTGEDDETQEN